MAKAEERVTNLDLFSLKWFGSTRFEGFLGFKDEGSACGTAEEQGTKSAKTGQPNAL